MLLAIMLFFSTANILSQETNKSLLTDYWITLFDKHIGEFCYMQECCENGGNVFIQDDFNKAGCQAYQPVFDPSWMRNVLERHPCEFLVKEL